MARRRRSVRQRGSVRKRGNQADEPLDEQSTGQDDSSRRQNDLHAIVLAAGTLGRKRKAADVTASSPSPPLTPCIKKQKISNPAQKKVKFSNELEVRSHTSEDESSGDEQIRGNNGKSRVPAPGPEGSFAQRRAAHTSDESRHLQSKHDEDEDDHQDQIEGVKKFDEGSRSAEPSYNLRSNLRRSVPIAPNPQHQSTPTPYTPLMPRYPYGGAMHRGPIFSYPYSTSYDRGFSQAPYPYPGGIFPTTYQFSSGGMFPTGYQYSYGHNYYQPYQQAHRPANESFNDRPSHTFAEASAQPQTEQSAYSGNLPPHPRLTSRPAESQAESTIGQVTSDLNSRQNRRRTRQGVQQSNAETVVPARLAAQRGLEPLTREEHLAAFLSIANQNLTREEMDEALEHAKHAGCKLGWND